jgi:hypothetical protein
MLDADDVCDEADDDYGDGGSASGLVADGEDFKVSVKTLHATACSVWSLYQNYGSLR